jgi:hypothetical protein
MRRLDGLSTWLVVLVLDGKEALALACPGES